MMLTMAWAAMSAHAVTVTDTIFNRYAHEDFAFGADVSFVPQMESWGTKWLDKKGTQKDILQILNSVAAVFRGRFGLNRAHHGFVLLSVSLLGMGENIETAYLSSRIRGLCPNRCPNQRENRLR